MEKSSLRPGSSRKPSTKRKQSTFQGSRMLTPSELQSLKQDMRRAKKRLQDILAKEEPA